MLSSLERKQVKKKASIAEFKAYLKAICEDFDLTLNDYKQNLDDIIYIIKDQPSFVVRAIKTLKKQCLYENNTIAINSMVLLYALSVKIPDIFIPHVGTKSFMKSFLVQLPKQIIYPPDFSWEVLKSKNISKKASNDRYRIKWCLYLLEYWAKNFSEYSVFVDNYQSRLNAGTKFPKNAKVE